MIKIKDYYTFIAILVITFIVGAFIAVVLDRIYYRDNFNQEITIKVQPKGTKHFPYYPHHHYNTTLPEELHRVIWKNGNIVKVNRIGYAYE